MDEPTKTWKTLDTIAEIKTKWVTIHGDRMLDDQNNELEYWHCDRADSAIIIARQGERYILTRPAYRPGVGKVTLDFAGGRIAQGATPQEAAQRIIVRELGIPEDIAAALTLQPINQKPWLVDSSFSSQKLYGFLLEIPAGQATTGIACGLDELLAELACLQCRSLLLETLRS